MHSIIIPHRNRQRYLPICLWSLWRSACACEIRAKDWRCWVIDTGSEELVSVPRNEHFGLLHAPVSRGIFNKPRALNIGLELALLYDKADVVTFLDGDAVVGKRWMETVAALDDRLLTQVSYRVRYLEPKHFAEITKTADSKTWDRLTDSWFAEYETFLRAHEGYGAPDNNSVPGRAEPSFGNSQFSIRTDTLGDLRWNEDFAGRGSEDLWMMRAIARRCGWDGRDSTKQHSYLGMVVTDADHAMFHFLQDSRLNDWAPPVVATANYHRYLTS